MSATNVSAKSFWRSGDVNAITRRNPDITRDRRYIIIERINVMKMILFIISLILLFTSTTFSQQAQDALRPDLGDKLGTCDACGMDVFERMLTRVEITTDDETFYACGMGCAFGMTKEKEGASMKVVDFTTMSLIEAEHALYITGSLLTPVRAMMPVFAFGSNDDAEAFVNKYGGTVHGYVPFKEFVLTIREERGR